MENTTVQTIKENCVGYFYGWSADTLISFGSNEDKKIIPWKIILGVQPINRLESIIHKMPYYWEIDKNTVGPRLSQKIEKRNQQNYDKTVVYHTPLDCKRMYLEWKWFDDFDKKFASRISYSPDFSSPEEYSKALKERFEEPYFIHHRNRCTKIRPREITELYIVGEKQHTSKLIEQLIEEPDIKEMIKEIFDEKSARIVKTLDLAYNTQDTLILYDTTRKPRKQEIKINRQEI